MSIATALTAVGTFLSGPIMTGISNVASVGTLGVSIATKVDTHNMKSTLSGIRSDIHTLDNDILALTGDINDFRAEHRWNVALSGGTPIRVTNGGNPQVAQLQLQPQQPQVQQVQQIAQPVQQVAQQPQVAQPAQEYITKNDFNTAISNIVGAMPTIVGQAVQQAINAASPATPPTNPAAPVNPTTPPATPPTNPANPANPPA